MIHNIKLINFTNLSLEEKKMILEWRNNPSIQKWMYTKKDIALKDHLDFINSLKEKKDKLYFLVKKEESYIGVIDFVDIKKNSLNMGLYANPNIKGVGKILMNEIIRYSFETLKVKTIKAEAFQDNIKAKKLYELFGFKMIKEDLAYNKKIFLMELYYENSKF